MNLGKWIGWILGLSCALAGAAPTEIGVLVVHGKQGWPDRDVARLAGALRNENYAVEVPIMPWAQDRIYAASYGDALRQLDREVSALSRRGLRLIFIAGHSLGANAALGYAAAHSGLAGLALLAPGHFPEDPVYQERVRPYRERALKLAAAGRGDEVASFRDPIQDFMIEVRAAPVAFLSYTDPAGPAVMWRSAAAIRSPIPILLVQENNPAVTGEDERIFRAAPADSLSCYLHSPAEHVRVPDESIGRVLAWIKRVAAATPSESTRPHILPARR